MRADVRLDQRVNYVRMLGENNLSVIMSFTLVNRVSSSVAQPLIGGLDWKDAHIFVIETLHSNGQHA